MADAAPRIPPVHLDGIPKTLLVPLYFRAQERKQPEPLLEDADARRMLEALDVDLSRLDEGFGSRIAAAGTVNRTLLIDDAVCRFQRERPSGVVLNVGCGLDARFRRLDDGARHWIDLDVEEVIRLRRLLLPCERPRHAAVVGSLLEEDWIETLPFRETRPWMLVCEGTLMHFREPEVRAFLERVVERLPVERLCVEVIGPWMVGKVHPTVRAIGLDGNRLPWGTRNFEALARWHPRLRVADVRRPRQPDPSSPAPRPHRVPAGPCPDVLS